MLSLAYTRLAGVNLHKLSLWISSFKLGIAFFKFINNKSPSLELIQIWSGHTEICIATENLWIPEDELGSELLPHRRRRRGRRLRLGGAGRAIDWRWIRSCAALRGRRRERRPRWPHHHGRRRLGLDADRRWLCGMRRHLHSLEKNLVSTLFQRKKVVD